MATINFILALVVVLCIILILATAAPVSSNTNQTNTTTTALRPNSTNTTSSNNSCNCEEPKGDPICGSNGITFPSASELCLYNCRQNKSLTIKYAGRCRNCTEYSLNLSVRGTSSQERRDMLFKCLAKTYTPSDLISPPYKPECFSGNDNHIFKPKQENRLCHLHWCASPDGTPITGTVKFDYQPLQCDGICTVGNVTYNNGDKLMSSCGICQCTEGTMLCYEEYCEIEEDDIYLLNSLKMDILKFFIMQYQLSDVRAEVGLHYIRIHTIDIQDSETPALTSWKFQHYDMDNDESLSQSDLQHFYDEVYRLIGTNSFKSHFDRLLDADNNGAVSKQEFRDLFILEEASGSFSSSSGRRSVN
ncbi:PREDICTED: uncharacterized protein LOC109593722 [Amphimedon queenslandica]|uniref:Kazal-like domain-containing protein n=1 Tax=Amphimedon queenslandica TaxID=400682 RepID=A0A1X7VN23_AMPQE|nr:PREDICTED: uncharacterized protein LOC109593722 [Amphimedon queenslandica]|eukprot:XP_019864270.1 PREDICTED: uncharacterized protein LOC109593722 [Amphimedon queenslandica]